MSFPINHGEVTAVIGQKNSGKSVLMEHLFCEMNRFVLADPNSEHGPPSAVAVRSWRDVWQRWMDGQTQQVIRDHRGALREDRLTEYLRAVGQLQDLYLGIDECHNYMDHRSGPGELKDFAKYAVSHQNIGLVFGVHMASDIPSWLWNQIDNFIIFAYGNKWDSKIAGSDLPDKGKIKRLDPSSFQFYCYEEGVGNSATVRGPVPIPDHLG